MHAGIKLSRLEALGQTARLQLPELSEVGSTHDHLEAAVDWLYRSQDVTDTGGSSAGFNLAFGWEEPYPETTGYIIPTLFRYADETNVDEPRDHALQMAEWLLSVQSPTGGFPGSHGSGGQPRVFNTGQILFGLVAAYRETERDEFRQAAVDAADWLVDVQDPDGAWSEYTYNEKSHVYHTRVAWSLLEAASLGLVRDQAYSEAAQANYEWALKQQRPNGWFENAAFERGESPFLHTIAYTVRGLIEGGVLLDDSDLFEAGKRSADILLDCQSESGILKGRFDSNWNGTWYYCLPGNAQVANIWLRLFEETGERQYLTSSSHTIQFLKRHQARDGGLDISGALPGSYPIFGRYMFLRYPNWGTKFLADAFIALIRAKSTRGESNSKVASRTDDDILRVCILFDGEYTMRWVADSIEHMLKETNAEISLVVINDDSGFLSRGNLKRGMKYPAYYLFQIGGLVTDKVRNGSNYDQPVHISDISSVGNAPWLRTYPSETDGLWNELPDDVIHQVSSSSDVIYRRGFGLIRNDILSAVPYGVISYHHGDPRKYRGGPAGFWEYMHDESKAGAMIQSLTDELDAGIVQAYDEVDISTCESWKAIRKQLYTETTHLLAEAIVAIQDERKEAEIIDNLGPVRHPPSGLILGKYTLKRLRNMYAGCST